MSLTAIIINTTGLNLNFIQKTLRARSSSGIRRLTGKQLTVFGLIGLDKCEHIAAQGDISYTFATLGCHLYVNEAVQTTDGPDHE